MSLVARYRTLRLEEASWMGSKGRPTRAQAAARRRAFVVLVVEGQKYDRAAVAVGMKPATALRLVSDPAFHAEVWAAHRERVA